MTDLVLGTANIGLAYGQALSRDLPDDEQALDLLAAADRAGFSALDTAAAYGVAERRIGFRPGRIEPRPQRDVVVGHPHPYSVHLRP